MEEMDLQAKLDKLNEQVNEVALTISGVGILNFSAEQIFCWALSYDTYWKCRKLPEVKVIKKIYHDIGNTRVYSVTLKYKDLRLGFASSNAADIGFAETEFTSAE